MKYLCLILLLPSLCFSKEVENESAMNCYTTLVGESCVLICTGFYKGAVTTLQNKSDCYE
jgi:hypothetical protein